MDNQSVDTKSIVRTYIVNREGYEVFTRSYTHSLSTFSFLAWGFLLLPLDFQTRSLPLWWHFMNIGLK